MKVMVLRQFLHGKEVLRRGTQVEVSETVARELIGNKLAAEIKSNPQKTDVDNQVAIETKQDNSQPKTARGRNKISAQHNESTKE